ncbi:MAG TPA: histidinol phosphate phosphatase, partial [Acholeplasmatales bacterium]|nr:histidinol phosphate phosphatase [Acholeplasmatales bacterium]
MNKVNYHNHTYLCKHAEGMPIDYVKRAVELKYSEIGISDHGPLPAAWAHLRMNRDEFENIYLPGIESARVKFENKIKIFSGLEIEYHEDFDYYYPKLLKEVDYLILGQHISMLGNEVHDLYHFMNDETVTNYKKLVVTGLKTNCFRILAHPDVFMYRYTAWNDLAAQVSREII